MKHITALFALAFAFAVALAAPVRAQEEPPPEVPEGWTCTPGFFGSDDGCDCGCGVADPDCEDATVASCEFNQCEADTDVPTAANPTQCAANTCGDGYRAGEEVCDAAGGAGCSGDCATVDEGFACDRNAGGCHVIACGDGIVDFSFDPETFEVVGEECDDANTASGDGCSATCVQEEGFSCPEDGEPCTPIVCGDGLVDFASEGCDDGNTTPGDGCDAACAEEEGFSCREPGQPCVAPPAGWTCNVDFYEGGALDGCDCGCGVEDPDCGAGSCVEPNCDDAGEICEFCHDETGAVVTCGAPAEGEGEGEGGEGEGEGAEGEGEDDEGPFGADPDVDEGGAGCASTSTGTTAVAALFALALLRRRRR